MSTDIFVEVKAAAVARFLDDEPLFSPIDGKPVEKTLYLCLLSKAHLLHNVTVAELRQRYGQGIVYSYLEFKGVLEEMLAEILRERPDLACGGNFVNSRVKQVETAWMDQILEVA